MSQQLALDWSRKRQTFSPSELNGAIKEVLDGEFGLLWVAAEISGVKRAASGHVYFNLKDASSQIKAVLFRNSARLSKVQPQDGLAVMARGRIDVYEARGDYQLIVDLLEPQGLGALQLAFEQLKERLAYEGLFDSARKRKLPRFPRRIGIVTSPSGAVIRDMIHVIERRHPGLHLRLYPALVQGEGSVDAVIRGLDYFSNHPWADVVILARGGGSLEDLWTFNEEAVARAIAASTVPVVSAIGHETDYTIADFVADLRAPTPSAAAEVIIETRDSLLQAVDGLERALTKLTRYQLSLRQRRLQDLGTDRPAYLLQRRVRQYQQQVDDIDHLLRYALRDHLLNRQRRLSRVTQRLHQQDLRLRVAEARTRDENLRLTLNSAIAAAMVRARRRLEILRPQLDQLSPLRILERGYAVVQTTDGQVVRTAADSPAGTSLRIRLAQGILAAESRGPVKEPPKS